MIEDGTLYKISAMSLFDDIGNEIGEILCDIKNEEDMYLIEQKLLSLFQRLGKQ